MEDPERLGGIFFFSLLGLVIAILVLGISVKVRLGRMAEAGSSTAGPAVMVLLALVLAFFSTFLPFLAALPALGLLIRGFQVLSRRGVLNRDGGIVIVMTGLAWALFTGVQAACLAWGKTIAGAPIRIDIVITIPVMAVVSFFGWSIGSGVLITGVVASCAAGAEKPSVIVPRVTLYVSVKGALAD